MYTFLSILCLVEKGKQNYLSTAYYNPTKYFFMEIINTFKQSIAKKNLFRMLVLVWTLK